MFLRLISLILTLAPSLHLARAQEVITEESAVPKYTLPDPLAFEDGRPVTSPQDWQERRAEILKLFSDHVYGNVPSRPMAEVRIEERK